MKLLILIISLLIILYNLVFILALDEKLPIQDLWFDWFLNLISSFDVSIYNFFNDNMLTVDERSKKVRNLVKGRLIILLMIIVFCFILFNAINKLLIK